MLINNNVHDYIIKFAYYISAASLPIPYYYVHMHEYLGGITVLTLQAHMLHATIVIYIQNSNYCLACRRI